MISTCAILPLAIVNLSTRCKMRIRRQDDPQFSVDERRLREAHGLRKSDYAPGPSDCALGPSACAANLSRGTWTRCGFVNANKRVRIEHGDEPFEISGAEGREEGVDQRALLRAGGLGNCVYALHPAACATGELPRGVRRAPDNLGDFFERHIEHIVQDESEALVGSEAVKYHKQGNAD